MQGTPPPWDDSEQPSPQQQPPPSVQVAGGFVPMNEGSFLTGTTQMAPGQLIMLQPPSKAANTIGILVIIYGALQGLGLMSLVVEPVDLEGNVIDYPFGAKMVDALSSVLGLAGFIAAGVLLTRYEKRGVYLAMSVIGVQFVLGILSLVLGSPDGGLAELIGEDQALAVYAGISGFCSGFCALLVAIPLMVSNNGLK